MLTKRQKCELMRDGCFTVREAACFAKVSPQTLYLAMRHKELRYAKKGRRRLIPRAGLIEWLAMSIKE
jgi:excisionase family DNA binding protein